MLAMELKHSPQLVFDVVITHDKRHLSTPLERNLTCPGLVGWRVHGSPFWGEYLSFLSYSRSRTCLSPLKCWTYEPRGISSMSWRWRARWRAWGPSSDRLRMTGNPSWPEISRYFAPCFKHSLAYMYVLWILKYIKYLIDIGSMNTHILGSKFLFGPRWAGFVFFFSFFQLSYLQVAISVFVKYTNTGQKSVKTHPFNRKTLCSGWNYISNVLLSFAWNVFLFYLCYMK